MQETITEMLNRNRFSLAKTIINETNNKTLRKDQLVQAVRENDFINFSTGIAMKIGGNRYESHPEFKHPLFVKLLDSFGKVANNS
jgi:hypothetical protein